MVSVASQNYAFNYPTFEIKIKGKRVVLKPVHPMPGIVAITLLDTQLRRDPDNKKIIFANVELETEDKNKIRFSSLPVCFAGMKQKTDGRASSAKKRKFKVGDPEILSLAA